MLVKWYRRRPRRLYAMSGDVGGENHWRKKKEVKRKYLYNVAYSERYGGQWQRHGVARHRKYGISKYRNGVAKRNQASVWHQRNRRRGGGGVAAAGERRRGVLAAALTMAVATISKRGVKIS